MAGIGTGCGLAAPAVAPALPPGLEIRLARIEGTLEAGRLVRLAWEADTPDGPIDAEITWLRDGTPIPGATGETRVLEEADLAGVLRARLAVSDTAGRSRAVLASWLPAPVTPGAPDDPILAIPRAEVEALRFDGALRGPRAAPARIVGVDPLPAGVILSAGNRSVEIPQGVTAAFEGWDFDGHQLVVKGTLSALTDCRFSVRPDRRHPHVIDVYATATVGPVAWNAHDGRGLAEGPGSWYRERIASDGAGGWIAPDHTAPIERNDIRGHGADGIKTAGAVPIRWNHLDTIANLPPGTGRWQADVTYAAGDYAVSAKGHAFRSKVDGNTGNVPPDTKTDDAVWDSYDPHGDQINVFAVVPGGTYATTEVVANYLNRSQANRAFAPGTGLRAVGINNGLRVVPNTGSGHPFEPIRASRNIITAGDPDDNKSFPVSLGTAARHVLTGNWIGPKQSGAIVHPNDLAVDHRIEDNPGYDFPVIESAGGPLPQASALTIAEPGLPVYDSDPFGAGLAAIPLGGTHDAPGAVLQWRMLNAADGTALGGWSDVDALPDGTWQAVAQAAPSFTPLRFEIRDRAATGVGAVQAGRAFAGFIVGGMGQSLVKRPVTFDIGGVHAPAPADALWFLENDNQQGGRLALGPRPVTGTAEALGLERMAATFGAVMDAPVLWVDLAYSGRSRREMTDPVLGAQNGVDWRTWMADPVGYIRERGSDVGLLWELWHTADAAVQGNFATHFAPAYLGLMDDGAGGYRDHDGSTVDVVPSRAYTPVHRLFDLSADGTGGLFDPARTKWAPHAGASWQNADGRGADGFATNDTQKSRLAAAIAEAAEADPAWAPVTLRSVPGPGGQAAFGGHLAFPGNTHVQEDVVDGESLAGVSHALSVARALGRLPREEPRPVAAAWAPDGAFVDVTVSLPSGGRLSTPLVEEAAGAYAGSFEETHWVAPGLAPADLPELHEVQGFAIARGGAVETTGFAAVITDPVAGIVRITPQVPFADGDRVLYGYRDGSYMPSEADNIAARPHLRHPIETRNHVGGAGYGYPLRRDPDGRDGLVATGIAAAPSGGGGSSGTEVFAFDRYPDDDHFGVAVTEIAGGWRFDQTAAGKRGTWDLTALIETGGSYRLEVTLRADATLSLDLGYGTNKQLTVDDVRSRVTVGTTPAPVSFAFTAVPFGGVSHLVGFVGTSAAVAFDWTEARLLRTG